MDSPALGKEILNCFLVTHSICHVFFKARIALRGAVAEFSCQFMLCSLFAAGWGAQGWGRVSTDKAGLREEILKAWCTEEFLAALSIVQGQNISFETWWWMQFLHEKIWEFTEELESGNTLR